MAQPSQILETFEVNKSYGQVHALKDVNFSMNAGEVRALLGKNGAGKSTMIRMLSGAEATDSGRIVLSGEELGGGGVDASRRLGVRTVYQELSLIGSMTVAENMFMGHWPRTAWGTLDHKYMVAETREALKRLSLDIDPNRDVEELSVADQQMVEIARALRDDPRLLILDEPTSSLAAREVERVLDVVRTIAKSGVAVIYVSHRLGEIRQIAATVSIFRDGELIETADLANVTARDIVRLMVGSAVEESSQITAAPDPDAPVVLDVRGVRLQPLLTDISIQLHSGEVLGIAGVLGSGRTELLRVMAGIASPDEGVVTAHGKDITGRGASYAMRQGVGMTQEDRKELGIFEALGVDENMALTDWRSVSSGPLLSSAKLAAAANQLISALQIKATPHDWIDTLSGGNQQKVVIGRWLHAGSTILLMDEPTRGVDVEAKAQVYALVRELAAAGRGIVFVSSEIEELRLACDRVLILRGGHIVSEYAAPEIDTDAILAEAMQAS